MSFKKRTTTEINASVESGDYTGGYEYLPWLIYMRGVPYLLPMLAMFIGGIYYATQIGTFWFGIGAIAVSILIKYKLIRDYRLLRKGDSR